MKVGTDAILLSAWCDVAGVKNILDVGTGCGIISLLLATRTNANIDAVEYDSNSAKEAKLNFNNFSNNQLSIYHDDFNNFVENTTKKYDFIISNPPFFPVGGMLPNTELRRSTRHTSTLTHSQLCIGAASLLSAEGKFCIVLPTSISNDFITTANSFNLHLRKQQLIYPKPNKAPNRINLEFNFKKSKSVISENITIRDKNNLYTNEYRHYVGDYITI